MFSKKECQQWLQNPSRNPTTNRLILPGRKIYVQYEKSCVTHNLLRKCDICFADFLSGLSCAKNHEFCKNCVETNALIALKKKGKVICMTNCDAEFGLEQFNQELRDLLLTRQRELEFTKTDFVDEMTKIITRRCPVCSFLLMKNGGCNELVCECGTKICYVCSKDISTEGYRHFCNCSLSCDCKKCKSDYAQEAEDKRQ